MKPTSFSVVSVMNEDGYLFKPIWRDSDGEELCDCPFGLDEAERGIEPDGMECDFLRPGPQGFVNVCLEGMNLSRKSLSGLNFSHACLCMTDLTQADLSGSCLRFADLTFAELGMAVLTHADLRSADLCKANLRAAFLDFADLSDADLEHADLSEAILRATNLKNVDLRFAKVRGAVFDDRTVLPFSVEAAVRLGMVCHSGNGGVQHG